MSNIDSNGDLSYFETIARGDDVIVVRKDDCPDWVFDTVFECHDGSLPDDWTYAKIASIFDSFTMGDYDPDDDDASYMIAESLVDIYTSDLMAWAATNVVAIDDATEQFGQRSLLESSVATGQWLVLDRMVRIIAESILENEGMDDDD